MFSIEPEFSGDFIDKLVDSDMKVWFDELLKDWRRAGKKHVDMIRKKTKMHETDKSTFGNITWNLRSSIGYLIIFDGEIIEEYFPVAGPGAEGAIIGVDWAREVGLQINEYEGIQMVIAAGMEYAVFVEDKNFDVISFSTLSVLPEILELEMGS